MNIVRYTNIDFVWLRYIYIYISHGIVATLEKLRKSLDDYLEAKRQAFPRFYFLSSDELLEVLAHTKEPTSIQPHLCKLFDAITHLEFSDAPGGMDVLSMSSREGERVVFGRNVKARGNIEDWLHAVETNMKTTIHRSMKGRILS